jgi:hypothetical protein
MSLKILSEDTKNSSNADNGKSHSYNAVSDFQSGHGHEIFITFRCRSGSKKHLPLHFDICCQHNVTSSVQLNKVGFAPVTVFFFWHMEDTGDWLLSLANCIIPLSMIRIKMVCRPENLVSSESAIPTAYQIIHNSQKHKAPAHLEMLLLLLLEEDLVH